MNWAKFLLFGWLGLVLSLTSQAQRFNNDPAKFNGEVVKFIQSAGTEASYQVGNKFSSAWSSNWSEDQRKRIIQITNDMARRGHVGRTYYNFFAAMAFAVNNENLSTGEMDQLLTVTEEVIRTRKKVEYANYVHGLNYFMARRYLSFSNAMQARALGGTYSFKVLNNNVTDYLAADGTVVKLDSIAAGDAFGAYEGDEGDPWRDPWKEDQYLGLDSTAQDDPWANNDPWGDNSQQDDPWANNDPWGDNAQDDPWGDANSQPDPWADDPWGNNQPVDPWAAKASKTPQRPKVDPPIYHDYIAETRDRYYHPPLNGPVVELTGINISIKTPYDSISIKNLNGNFLLASREFAGKGGTMNWPEVHDKMDGAIVEFGEWHFNAEHDHFWTPNAKLTFDKFSDQPIEGKFEFRSVRHAPGKGTKYPIFSSNKADLKLQLSEKASYEGGLEVRGSEFHGKSISREKGTLTLNAGKGRQVYISSLDFVLADSSMTAELGEFLLVHGSDTIYHPAVQMWYDASKEILTIARTRSRNMTPFRSTYFGMEINADVVKWDLAADSLTFNVLNAKSEIPMSIESDKYFTPDRYTTMNPIFPIHPLVMAVKYSRKYGNIQQFYESELAIEYKMSDLEVRGAMKVLDQYGLIRLDQQRREITMLPKAFHYFDAAAKKEDYDYIYLKSIINSKPNGILKLDSGQLVVNGVKSFSVVQGYELEIEPDSTEQIVLLKDRNFRFNGKVTEGDFIYHGQNFEFNYDQFLINMPKIDSMKLNVPVIDSLSMDSTHASSTRRETLSNSIQGTSGILYIEEPNHKAGHEENDAYPYFVSDSEAIVYFNKRDILNGAYDRSVYFIVPPFEVDSIDRNSSNFEFEGRFVSGGIFPEFDETLSIQPDRSFGFTHQIPPSGYNLYGTEAKTYEKIRLNSQGIRGGGQIDFLTTQIFSEDFIYYPDSVTADGSGGRIKPGDYKGASFPEAILGAYDMYWLPRKDSMYLRTVNEPFKFYNATAELEGHANITTKGVFGGGVMKTRGSKSISNELNFKEKTYSARHADFAIETSDPEKPAMSGDDISLNFDLVNNTAVIRPEKVGTAAFSFPYAKMKTSITEATWDLEDSLIVMTKPANVPLKDSYFYSTREELDSLVFSGTKATYDINTYELTVEGIPYITVADSRIIPEGNKTTILENSQLQEFTNAEIIIDTLNGYHRLTKGKIIVVSRNKFEGSAFYQLIVGNDTLEVRFDTFSLEEVPVSNKKTQLMTVSGGFVLENQNAKIAPGFYYKGQVNMYANKRALELDGSVRLDAQNLDNKDLWIPYVRTDSSIYPHVPLTNAVYEDGSTASAGIHLTPDKKLYATFVEKKNSIPDMDFYSATGEISYDLKSSSFKIQTPDKGAGNFQGHTYTYNDSTSEMFIEGPVSFLQPTTTDITVQSAVTGRGNEQAEDYSLDAMILMNYVIEDAIIDEMALDIVGAVERMGANPANDPTDELLSKLANVIGNGPAVKYRENMLSGYKPLLSASKDLEKSLLISGVKMKWNPQFGAWHNTTKIGLSHMGRTDINAKVDGFLEFRRDETGADVMNLFIQVSPETWYFISYQDKNLLMYASNPIFNDRVKARSNLGKQKPGQLVFVVGDVNETLGFINAFRKNYFGIDTPYNLSFPSDASLEDEKFDTIEDDDDGFGF